MSRQRAQNVYLYLSGDADGWAEHSQLHHELEDVQRILKWIARTFPEFPCDPGPIDDLWGGGTRDAIQAFRDAYENAFGEGLEGGDKVGADDWKAYGRMYDEAVALRLVDADVLQQVRSAMRFVQPPGIGFGERYPTENPGCDDLDSERNRRVEIVFVDEQELDFLSDESQIEQHLYHEETPVVRQWLTVGFPAKADELEVRVVFRDGRPASGASCRHALPGGEVRGATADADGYASFSGLPRSTCEFRLSGFEAADWEADYDGTRELPPPPEYEEDEELVPNDDVHLTPAQRRVLDDDPVEEEW